MKRIGIITIYDNNNYGNRLQNYALQEVLKSNGCEVETLKNNVTLNDRDKFLYRKLKYLVKKIVRHKNKNTKRYKSFDEFNKNIKFAPKMCTAFSDISKDYDYFVVGSDQVWNPNFARLSYVDLLRFANGSQKIAYAASFGISELSDSWKNILKKDFEDFKAISLRENEGKKIVKSIVQRDDVEVVLDPTMLLSSEEWDKVLNKSSIKVEKKYILMYFLGQIDNEWKAEIERIAIKFDCEIINILDKDSKFYQTGPSEFLYLEKNAFLICTDSFHSSVFSIVFNVPFIIFERNSNTQSMNSRIHTLLSKFNLQSRKFTGTITSDLLKSDYKEAQQILKKEKEKSIKFLKRALDIEE